MEGETSTQMSPQVPSVGEWVITLLLMIIPIVNIIMLFIWGFSEGTHPSKANWAKATLIWMAIAIVLNLLMFTAFGSLLFLGGGA